MSLKFKGKRRVEPEEVKEEVEEVAEETEESEESEDEGDDMSEIFDRFKAMADKLEEMYSKVQGIEESLKQLAVDGIYINDEVISKETESVADEVKNEDVSLEDLDFKL